MQADQLIPVHYFRMGQMALTVPDMEAGCCVGSEGNGVSLGERGEGGPAPPGGGKDKQSVLNKRQRQHGQRRGRPIKSDMMKEWRKQSERSSEQDKIM
jgi:hypothetical protein